MRSSLPGTWNFPTGGIGALNPDVQHVVLVDDLVSSGSQATVQLQSWMGVPREHWLDPTEQNVDAHELPSAVRALLVNIPVDVVFAVGDLTAKATLESVGSTLGLEALTVRIERPFSVGSDTLERPDDLDQYLADVGEAVLCSMRGEEGRASARKDALGYGGRTAWITGTFNVPTCCPPALWCPGIYKDVPWVPLLIRRGHSRRAIFL